MLQRYGMVTFIFGSQVALTVKRQVRSDRVRSLADLQKPKRDAGGVSEFMKGGPSVASSIGGS
jgi:hypothetical protein